MERIENKELHGTGLPEHLIQVYLNMPAKAEIDTFITENLLSAGLSENQLAIVKEQLANYGFEVRGKEELQQYLQNKIMSHLNLSNAHAENLLGIFNKSLSGYLQRKIKNRETELLRIKNEVAALNSNIRLNILRREVEERIEANKKSLNSYIQSTSGNITAMQLINATQSFLNTDMSANFTKNDEAIKRFLEGDTNAIIEL
jgi:hypothetical protein